MDKKHAHYKPKASDAKQVCGIGDCEANGGCKACDEVKKIKYLLWRWWYNELLIFNWFRAYNRSLGGVPKDLIASKPGKAREIREYLELYIDKG